MERCVFGQGRRENSRGDPGQQLSGSNHLSQLRVPGVLLLESILRPQHLSAVGTDFERSIGRKAVHVKGKKGYSGRSETPD